MTKYAYCSPKNGAWVGPFSSRDDAAHALLEKFPRETWGTTAPVLVMRGEQPIVDVNSSVHFKYETAHPYTWKDVFHDNAMLSRVRTP